MSTNNVARSDVTSDTNGLVVSNGIKYYYLDGHFHSTERPAVEFQNGDTLWYFNDSLHRDNGPAIEQSGNKYWYQHGLRHRIDGPAVDCVNGYKEWYINGKSYTKEEFESKTKAYLEKDLFVI